MVEENNNKIANLVKCLNEIYYISNPYYLYTSRCKTYPKTLDFELTFEIF